MTTAHTATADGTARPHNRIRVGYARVSTRSQDHQAQLDTLAAAHCREMVVERPALAANGRSCVPCSTGSSPRTRWCSTSRTGLPAA